MYMDNVGIIFMLQEKILSCLKLIREAVEVSDFFKSHEVSLFMCFTWESMKETHTIVLIFNYPIYYLVVKPIN